MAPASPIGAGVGLELSRLDQMVRWPDSLESRSVRGS